MYSSFLSQEQTFAPFSRGRTGLRSPIFNNVLDVDSDYDDDYACNDWISPRLNSHSLGRVLPGLNSMSRRGLSLASPWGMSGACASDFDDELCGYDAPFASSRFASRMPTGLGGITDYNTGTSLQGFWNGGRGFSSGLGLSGGFFDNAGVSGFGGRRGAKMGSFVRQLIASKAAMQENIVEELIEDREIDLFQAQIIRELTRTHQPNRNRVAIVHAMAQGENIPKHVIFRLLCEDLAVDRASEAVISKILKDKVTNRNSDNILHDFMSGNVHLPYPDQEIWTTQHIMKNKALGRVAQSLISPNAGRKLARAGVVDHVIEELVVRGQGPYGI